MMENKEILSKVLKKSDELKEEKARKKRKIYTCVSLVASFIFIISLSFAMPVLMESVNFSALANNANTGTFFATRPYLGYIIMGIISFILGIVVTLICYKIKNNERK
ncbi:MAG: hypothetical protein R3Y35_04305 [Clostridia bacterium]